MTSAKVQIAARRPDEDNWFVEPVVADWYDRYVAEGNTELAKAVPDTRMRASWAGDCARALAYHFAGFEESDPPTVADCWRFNVGSALHEHVQRSVERAFPGSVSELKVRLTETDGSAHMDMQVLRQKAGLDRPWRTAVEIKTINGTGFRRFISLRNPEGPRYKYAYQAALAASSLDPLPDDMLLAVFSLECLSPKETREQQIHDEYQRFSAQWTFSQEEYMALAEREKTRINNVIAYVDDPDLGWAAVPRKIPDPLLPERHKIINVERGIAIELDRDGRQIGQPGKAWQCGYCPFQSQCDEHLKEGR